MIGVLRQGSATDDLGLALPVAATSGTLDVESEPGAGATFRLHLPCIVEDIDLCQQDAHWEITNKELAACSGFGK